MTGKRALFAPQLVAIILFIFLFFTYPDAIMGAGMVMIWLVFILLLIAFGIYSYIKISGRSAESLGIQVRYDAGVKRIWVGSKGQNVPLRLQEEAKGLRISWAKQNYIFVIIVTTIIGPGMLALYLYDPGKLNLKMPLPMLIMATALWAFAWLAMATTLYRLLFTAPSVLVSAQSFSFYEGNSVKKVIWSRDISRISVADVEVRISDSLPVMNYVLVLETAEGAKDGVCITDKKQQIDVVRKALRNKGYSLE